MRKMVIGTLIKDDVAVVTLAPVASETELAVIAADFDYDTIALSYVLDKSDPVQAPAAE